ncbi:hypothetical protein [Bradyrhizobium sp. th.b2]|nr:hypothetical protein [Bradyrhizobium sp. th.b2]
MTADIEFLAVLFKWTLKLAALGGCAIATALIVVLIFKLFGGLDD